MSQVTRCPACRTSFRVVADQLRIARGWVRCGQCGEVFDASAQLVVSGQAATPAPMAPEPTPADPPLAEESIADRAGVTASPPAEAGLDAASSGEAMLVPAAPGQASPGVPLRAEADDIGEVTFVREAMRREFWNKPLVRAALGMLALLLLAALALQWAARQKDALAALHPQLVPLLQALCDPLGCDIRPLRRIASLAFDSTSFVKTGPYTYRLGFVLKNNDVAALEVPAVEVTLTDNREQALVRRVLTPAQFGASAATLGAHLELTGAAFLKVAGDSSGGLAPPQPLPVAGYRLLAFYP